MFLAVVLVLLVVGSIIYHIVSPWWFTPIASHWDAIDMTVDITFWITGAVFVAVNLFMAYAVIKFRYKKEARAHYEPENPKLESWLTIITALGVAALLAPGLWVWGQFVNVPEEAWALEAVGEQWRWTFRLPGKDGQLGTTDATLISVDNPFGMNPHDERGQDDLLIFSNEVHIPIAEPVQFLLRSKDVLHDFAVAEFRVKMDLVPGMVTYLWLEPIRTGTFEVLCEEHCGMGHFTMKGRVVVDSAEDFAKWEAEQMTYAQFAALPKGDAAKGQAMYAVCSACHGADGAGNRALNSPKLAGQRTWYTEHQLRNFKKGVRGALEEDEYGRQMAPMMATLADDEAIRHVSAYIATLPNTKPEVSIIGDVERGEDVYITCSKCHGNDGEGKYTMYAPRLAGQQDWYLKRQLHNYKHGIRGGSHDNDWVGPMMALMSRMLRDEESMDDVIAYINSMPLEAKAESVPSEG